MKKIFFLPLLLFIISCNNINKSYDDIASLTELKYDLISKFGKDAYYTKLNVSNSDYGSLVGVSQTSNPSSLKMSEWNLGEGSWNQISDITLELADNKKAKDFMFKIDKVIDFDILIKVVEDAKKKIINEKKMSDVIVRGINVEAPNNGDFNRMKYLITVASKSGGKIFNFWYKMDGSLDKVDY